MNKLLSHFQALGKVWDLCVLTATNDSQKAVYQLQLERLLRAGFLHPGTTYQVVADPQGKRLGSGGVTLHVLREVARLEKGQPGLDSRILILSKN